VGDLTFSPPKVLMGFVLEHKKEWVVFGKLIAPTIFWMYNPDYGRT